MVYRIFNYVTGQELMPQADGCAELVSGCLYKCYVLADTVGQDTCDPLRAIIVADAETIGDILASLESHEDDSLPDRDYPRWTGAEPQEF